MNIFNNNAANGPRIARASAEAADATATTGGTAKSAEETSASTPVQSDEEKICEDAKCLKQAARENLISDITKFNNRADKFLQDKDEGAQIRFVHSFLAGSLLPEPISPRKASSLQNMQMALSCPSASRLSLWKDVKHLHDSKQWPALGAAVGLFSAQQKADFDALMTEEPMSPHQTFRIFEATFGLYGARHNQTQTAAQKFLQSWGASNEDEDADEIDHEQFELLFRALTAQTNKGKHICALQADDLLLAVEAFCAWRAMSSSAEGSNEISNILKSTASFLLGQPGLPRTAQERLRGQWQQHVALSSQHQLPTENFDLELRLCFGELLELLEDKSGKESDQLKQLRAAENAIRDNLSQLTNSASDARGHASSWLVNTYRLLTGRKDINPQSKSYRDDFTMSQKPLSEKIADTSSHLDLEVYSEEYIKERIERFYANSREIVGQDAVKDEIVLHFTELLRGKQTLSPGLFGPSRVGKSDLLLIAFTTFFDDVQVHVINCRGSGPTLQGGEQKYVGAQAGDIAQKLMDAPIDERFDSSGKLIPARKRVIILFDDIDYASPRTQALAASAIAHEKVTDAYFNFELDLKKALYGLCGNDPTLTAHFRGRMAIIEVCLPRHESLKDIVVRTAANRNEKYTLSQRVIEKLASDEMWTVPRKVSGVSGLKHETQRLVAWAIGKVGNEDIRVRVGTADAIDRVANEHAHIDPDFRSRWWQRLCALKLSYDKAEAFREAYDSKKCRVEAMLHHYFPKQLESKQIYIATQSSSGKVLFDENKPRHLFEVLKLDNKEGLNYFKHSDSALPNGLRWCGNGNFVEAQQQLRDSEHLLLLWGQPRWLSDYDCDKNSEYLLALPMKDEEINRIRGLPGIERSDNFLKSVALENYDSMEDGLGIFLTESTENENAN